MRSDLESCYNRIIPGSHPSRPWLVRHASSTVFREKVGNDGFTAYKRVKGKEFKKELVKFGECIWYLKPKSKGKAKAECRWENGVFLGIRDESGEYIVGAPGGAIKVRSIRRKGSEEERWNWEEFNGIKGTPWEPSPGHPERESWNPESGDIAGIKVYFLKMRANPGNMSRGSSGSNRTM